MWAQLARGSKGASSGYAVIADALVHGATGGLSGNVSAAMGRQLCLCESGIRGSVCTSEFGIRRVCHYRVCRYRRVWHQVPIRSMAGGKLVGTQAQREEKSSIITFTIYLISLCFPGWVGGGKGNMKLEQIACCTSVGFSGCCFRVRRSAAGHNIPRSFRKEQGNRNHDYDNLKPQPLNRKPALTKEYIEDSPV